MLIFSSQTKIIQCRKLNKKKKEIAAARQIGINTELIDSGLIDG